MRKRPLLFRPSPRDRYLPETLDPRLGPLVASWRQVFPNAVPDESLDFEDWTEHAARLHAGLKIAGERLAILDDKDRAWFLDGSPVPAGAEVLFMGSWMRRDEYAPILGGARGIWDRYTVINCTPDDIALANGYASSETFVLHAGRQIALCGIRENSADRVDLDLYEHLSCLVKRGAQEVFIKVNRQKYMVTRIRLPKSPDQDAIKTALVQQDAGLAYATVHLEGQNNAFIVQDYVLINFEYRVIVVNHVPVAGAGCVENFTPLDNQHTWDAQVEKIRNCGKVEVVPELIERYRAFAEIFTREHRAERPACGNYTLDLGLKDGEVIVIELNARQNYGVYAMKFEAVLAAELVLS